MSALSLRQIAWMADAKDRRNWDYVAWACLHQPWVTKDRLSLERFHPLMNRSLGDFMDGQVFEKKLAECGLSKQLSNDEIEALWQLTLKREEERESRE